MNLIPVVLIAAVLATRAGAATIVETTEPGTGAAIALDPAAFHRLGQKGSGQSVTAGAGNPYVKRAGDPKPFGRFNPLDREHGSWIDSGDGDRTLWTVESEKAFTSLTFALTDAFDQKRDDRYGGKSYFRLRVGDAKWKIAKREKNGTLHWITVLFDDPVKQAKLRFITRLNDGYGIDRASVAPVPLPAAGWLLLAGASLLLALQRRSAA